MSVRNTLTLVLLLLALTVLVAGLAPPPAAPPPTPAPSRAGTPSPLVVRTLDASPRHAQTFVVRSGAELALTVHSDVADAVELQGLAGLRPIDPSTPVTFDVIADAPGDYPVVLAGRTVGIVRVTPAR